MAERRPRDLDAFAEVNGVGAAKLTRIFAPLFLGAIAAHRSAGRLAHARREPELASYFAQTWSAAPEWDRPWNIPSQTTKLKGNRCRRLARVFIGLALFWSQSAPVVWRLT